MTDGANSASEDLERVLRALDDEELYYISDVVAAVRDVSPNVIVGLLAEADSSSLRRQLCDLAGYMRLADAVPALIGCLQDEDEETRQSAAEALWKVPSAQAGAVLLEGLKELETDPQLWKRHNYVIAIGAARYAPARSTLTGELSLSDPVLVRLAKEALRLIDAGAPPI
jgi:HEAT repeat protein